jgi:hypothetical protein
MDTFGQFDPEKIQRKMISTSIGFEPAQPTGNKLANDQISTWQKALLKVLLFLKFDQTETQPYPYHRPLGIT